MNRKEVEAIRKRAISCGCTYTESGAYLRIRAAELQEVCDVALRQLADEEEQMELAL